MNNKRAEFSWIKYVQKATSLSLIGQSVLNSQKHTLPHISYYVQLYHYYLHSTKTKKSQAGLQWNKNSVNGRVIWKHLKQYNFEIVVKRFNRTMDVQPKNWDEIRLKNIW